MFVLIFFFPEVLHSVLISHTLGKRKAGKECEAAVQLLGRGVATVLCPIGVPGWSGGFTH